MADTVDLDQAEHEQISTSLEVEQLDTNLFRSKSLWLPFRARGVFGGQVISQAIVAATKCVKPEYELHSYFLLSASSAVPILYYVDRVREGRTYTTRSVRAVQNGRTVFLLICSFQIPEPWQPSHHWPMPNVPSPEDCKDEQDLLLAVARRPGLDEKVKETCLQLAEVRSPTVYTDRDVELGCQEREKSPVSVRRAAERIGAEGTPVFMYWMRPRDKVSYEAPFQKVSARSNLPVVANTLGLKRLTSGPDALAMLSSLDHSIFFYDRNFDCSDWILYVTVSPTAGSGRGVVMGRMYSRNGTLVAVTTQEGVVRADIRPPVEAKM
ncbi:hypothetical protein EW146_g1508 [Bondarzewia mesenterica]|uniref:Acyl-CoA thioesterase II domain-containing protein n=1 Tax=Bondarzewia mesenterica TaxID=1095465 RepID=A0A4S4M3P1_9AGAM|nr:hypothetical protein EW146_g1508 [Bondarzewia mesenterica]